MGGENVLRCEKSVGVFDKHCKKFWELTFDLYNFHFVEAISAILEY